MCGGVTSCAAKRTVSEGRPPDGELFATSATRIRYVCGFPSAVGVTYAVAFAVAPCLTSLASPQPTSSCDGLTTLTTGWKRTGSVETTVTRRTAASFTWSEYHMLRKPVEPVHDGSGLASSGPVVASPQSVAWTSDWNSDCAVHGRRDRSCGRGDVVARRSRLGSGGRHEARTSDRKQSHEP